MKLIRKLLWLFSYERIAMQKKISKQENCNHTKWNCDIQIRTIECIECGKRAWIEDYINLFKK